MVISDVPLITPKIREALACIFADRFAMVKSNVSPMLTYPEGKYAPSFFYHNVFQQNMLNVIYQPDGCTPMMAVFNFDRRATLRLANVLGLSKATPTPMLSGLRVFPNQTVPMHTDLNKGEIGRTNPIYSVVTQGSDGRVFLSNRKDGSRLACVHGLTEFCMVPTDIEHGAKAGQEPYDMIQIQLSSMGN